MDGCARHPGQALPSLVPCRTRGSYRIDAPGDIAGGGTDSTAQGTHGTRENHDGDGSMTIAADPLTIDDKITATAVARAAIAGYELVRLADGSFIATRWGIFRTLDHMAAVEDFLRRVEGAPAVQHQAA
jgi:hypothetical protein